MKTEETNFTAFLINELKPENKEDFENKINKLSEDNLKRLYKQFKSMEDKKISMAKLGTKLNYIKTLRGECPKGYEVEKFMAGGCVKCKKKAEENKIQLFGNSKRRIKINQKGAIINKTDTVHTDKGVFNLTNKKMRFAKLNNKTYSKLSKKDKAKVDMKDLASGKSPE